MPLRHRLAEERAIGWATLPSTTPTRNPVAKALDTETMTHLNSLVVVGEDGELDTGDEQDPQDVACNILLEMA